jgi:uncharacterized protein YegL
VRQHAGHGVTLQLGGSCPSLAEQADILLVVDRSNSMNDSDISGRPKIVAAKEAVLTFLDLMDLQRDQVGLATLQSTARLDVQLTQDKTAVAVAIAGIQATGGTDIAAGIDVAVAELSSPRHRAKAKPIIILLTDGNPFNSTRLTTVEAADRARHMGITIYSIGLGTDVDPNLLRVVARTGQYYFAAPTGAQLRDVYAAIAKRINATVLFKRVSVVEHVPPFMDVVANSAQPPAIWDAAARTLTWTFQNVPFTGTSVTYHLQPNALGTWPDAPLAHYEGIDGLNQDQHGDFPNPRIVVEAPSRRTPRGRRRARRPPAPQVRPGRRPRRSRRRCRPPPRRRGRPRRRRPTGTRSTSRSCSTGRASSVTPTWCS